MEQGQLIDLEPDEDELHVASHKGVFKPCPFCGKDSQVMRTQQNTSSRRYIAAIICCGWGLRPCMAGVKYSAKSRSAARAGVIKKWNTRTDKEGI